MRFSLVLATVGRTGELKNFLESLNAQTYRSFELIVVDQNDDDRLVPLIHSFQDHFPIIHLRSDKGLSRARNVGLRHASGDIIAFPDDDCLYPPNLLESVARWFNEHPEWYGLTGRVVDENGLPSGGRWDRKKGAVNRYNVWRRGISVTIFLRREVVTAVGPFDEDLGVGAGTPWGSGEETDYLIRALEAGFRIFYDPSGMVVHPNKHPDPLRAYVYGVGMGRVLRKHRYPLWFVFYQWLRPFGGALLSLSMGKVDKARYHWAVLRGRLLGWLSKE
ncbi:glycosyltransferase family 2 protein [Thermus thermophilus]|uniref:glycosyltransferase family 2 protein n=1 Tax=Thermus thermophilus TaxID=274 RepID=UPI0011657C87|nr:glycosyltransferase [Thermus thermophilus]BBL81899.1 glycosyl transferase [Thermus thermophilus]BBL84202.1 glycosyl transferase [Thermus thermophilus]